MADLWIDLVRDSLTELGGKQNYVPGARLRPAIDRKAVILGVDFREHLNMLGQSFSVYLSTLQSALGLQIIRRPGTDFLVGFDGANPAYNLFEESSNRQKRTLRRDVYAAFTRADEVHYYLPSSDQFTSDIGVHQDAIQVPTPTFEELILLRRSFIDSLSDVETADKLNEALDDPTNPLGHFQRRALELNIGQQWHDFNLRHITGELEKWAANHQMTPPSSWFNSTLPTEPLTSQEVLARIARHMTPEEVRNLSIPFRAVEALVRETLRTRN